MQVFGATILDLLAKMGNHAATTSGNKTGV